MLADLRHRLGLATPDELQVVDRVLAVLERGRAGSERRWERRLPTGPFDLDGAFHLVRRGRRAETACAGSWLTDDRVEVQDNPAIGDRCAACLRAAGCETLTETVTAAAFTAAFTASVTTGVTTAEIACAPTVDTATADTRPLRRPAGGAP